MHAAYPFYCVPKRPYRSFVVEGGDSFPKSEGEDDTGLLEKRSTQRTKVLHRLRVVMRREEGEGEKGCGMENSMLMV